jgi:hypothetical protein
MPTTRPEQASPADAGTAYGAFIADQLTEERSRKASLEARGVTTVTAAGTLVTVLFALTAGLTAAPHFTLPAGARVPLLIALIAFVIAAVFGLTTNLPLRYREPTARGLARLIDARFWAAPAQIGERRVAEAQVALTAAMRSANNLKVRLLILAIAAELIAVICLSCAVAIIVYHA